MNAFISALPGVLGRKMMTQPEPMGKELAAY
jgi:hypothetical protein